MASKVVSKHHFTGQLWTLGWWGRANVRGKEPCSWSSLHRRGRGCRYWADSGGQMTVEDAGGCWDIGAPVLPLLMLSTTSCESSHVLTSRNTLSECSADSKSVFRHWPGGMDFWLLDPFHFVHWVQMAAVFKPWSNHHKNWLYYCDSSAESIGNLPPTWLECYCQTLFPNILKSSLVQSIYVQ